MPDEFVLTSPVDMHFHAREGSMMKDVMPLTARTFAAGMAMPNTNPFVTDASQAKGYKAALDDCKAFSHFRTHVTLYFRTDFTYAELEEAKPHILAVKFYPGGKQSQRVFPSDMQSLLVESESITTNSHAGVDPENSDILGVLSFMEELEIPLSVHGEVVGYHEDRERDFLPFIKFWAQKFPRLKIILEHISTASAIDLLTIPNVYATVTPHHILLTGDSWVGPPLRPHLFCMPVAKRPVDRDQIYWLVTQSSERLFSKVMLGTDSAPHPENRKVAACGCAGIFHAPIALQILAHIFEDQNRFQRFVSDNARSVYGIEPPELTVRLVRKPFLVPESYGSVVPMFAGKELRWSVDSVK